MKNRATGRRFLAKCRFLAGCGLAAGFAFHLSAQTFWRDHERNIRFEGELTTNFGRGNNAPFWLNANQNGVRGIDADQGFLRWQLMRPAQVDSGRVWRYGYGIDAIVGYGGVEKAHLQQLFFDIEYGKSRFTLGQKQAEAEINAPELSTGAWVHGSNARPVPMLQWELRDWWNIAGEGEWAALKMHVAYGMMTDGRWQERYVKPGHHYVKQALLHTKSGYLRLGNPKAHLFTFTGGIEMATQFGGTVYNAAGWGGILNRPLSMPQRPSNFLYALIGKGGSDATDGEGYGNSAGNTLGSWRVALDFHFRRKGWRIRLYYDHFFEDESAAFVQYGWFDGLWGLALELPYTWCSRLVVEHLRTDYQSGPLYHDHTAEIPDQVSGADNYYNHNLYQGWQNYGMSMGNALFASPLYERNGLLAFPANRFRALHLGVSGRPHPRFYYRLLYTQLRSWGTYAQPFAEVQRQYSFLGEATYHLPAVSPSLWGKGWSFKVGVAFDRGTRLGRNTGVSLSVLKQGLLSFR